MLPSDEARKRCSDLFIGVRDSICAAFEAIEKDYAESKGLESAKFERTYWDRSNGGGGQMSVMRGNVFEKVGVNFSTVHGELTEAFAKELPFVDENGRQFFATGVSLVAHMKSPKVPSSHFNIRHVSTGRGWFGGGGDLTPVFPDDNETAIFHNAFESVCNKYDSTHYSYEAFKKWCDDYFYIKHRKEPRGVGGIFFDYLDNDFETDLSFVLEVGGAFRDVITQLVRAKMYESWTEEEKLAQLQKRGRYAEFNLLYDRGTRFGLMTDGNVDAILMSLPPVAVW